MDPEARVIVTAKDTSAAAFTSAERGLKTFGRSIQQTRRLAAGFGLVFTGRMFANWVKDAIEVEKLTDQQAIAIQGASKAMGALHSEFQNLARTAATELAPALETAAKFWRAFLFPTEGEQAAKQLDETRKKVSELSKEIARLQDGGFYFGNLKVRFEQLGAELVKQIDLMRQLEEQANKPTTFAPVITQEEWVRLEEFIYELNNIKRPPLITQEELVQLETFLYELNQREPLITQEEIVALEEFLNDLNTVQSTLTQDEWIDLESFIYDLNHMEKEANDAAASMGAGFRNAFADWLVDGEFKFSEFLKRVAAEWIASEIFADLGKLTAGGKDKGGIAGFFGAMFGGARAGGGPVTAGKAYKVGERGEEWFVPRTSGAIIPNGAGRGAIVQHFHIQAGLPPQWEAQLAGVSQVAASAAYEAVNSRMNGRR